MSLTERATTEIYTLSLHDALPISPAAREPGLADRQEALSTGALRALGDRVEAVVPADDLGHLGRSEEHTSELQSQSNLVCRLLLEKKKEQLRRDLRPQHRRRPGPR